MYAHLSADRLLLRRLADDVGVARVGDGHAGHAVVSTARRTEVDVVCERENKNTKVPQSVSIHITPPLSLPLPRASRVPRFPVFRVFASRRSIEPDVLPA